MLGQAFGPIAGPSNGFVNTTAINITAASVARVISGAQQSANQWRCYNTGPNTAFVEPGEQGTNAAAVIPVDGTPAAGFPIAPGEDVVITVPPQSNVLSVIGSAAGGTLYVTPGEGI